MQELYERIMSRPGDDFNIETLAEDANLSRATFYREWKKLSARSPYQLLLQNRINTAKWLLKQTGMTVRDVARQAAKLQSRSNPLSQSTSTSTKTIIVRCILISGK